jgi:hypothetical protein
MAWPGDSCVVATRFQAFGFPQIQCYIRPVPQAITHTRREFDWAYLEAGQWRNITFVLANDPSTIVLLGVAGASSPERVRFGNPTDDWPNRVGGQLRMFNVPVPFGALPAQLKNALPSGTLFLPRRV